MSMTSGTDVTVCKSELETLAMAGYQAALNDAWINGLITPAQRKELTKQAMEESITHETRAFIDRKQHAEANRAKD